MLARRRPLLAQYVAEVPKKSPGVGPPGMRGKHRRKGCANVLADDWIVRQSFPAVGSNSDSGTGFVVRMPL